MEVRQAEEEVFETPDVEETEASSRKGDPGSDVAGKSLHGEQLADHENVLTTTLDADAAFEVFHGRTFRGPSTGMASSSTGDPVQEKACCPLPPALGMNAQSRGMWVFCPARPLRLGGPFCGVAARWW
jgi:hypothetical protein